MGYFMNSMGTGLLGWAVLGFGIFFTIIVVTLIILLATSQKKNLRTAEQPTVLKSDGYADLTALGELHEKGILTDEEFDRKKAEVLSRL